MNFFEKISRFLQIHTFQITRNASNWVSNKGWKKSEIFGFKFEKKLWIFWIIDFKIFLFDDDLDGNADRAEIDEDDNGTSDIMAYDNNQDGEWDKYEKIS